VLRQRCFFVRQRTMPLNRIHRLIGLQQCSFVDQTQDDATRKLVNIAKVACRNLPPRRHGRTLLPQPSTDWRLLKEEKKVSLRRNRSNQEKGGSPLVEKPIPARRAARRCAVIGHWLRNATLVISDFVPKS
jgi:hypothetical protein